MPKYFDYVFLLLTFVIGITIGLYSGTNFSENVRSESESRIAKSVQDTVIAKLQREYDMSKLNEDNSYEKVNANNEYGEIEEKNIASDIITVSSTETKLLPSAEMIIKKNFTRCGHSEVKEMKIPIELVNYTKEDVEEKYSGWTIEEFNEKEIVLEKDFDANCTEHYVLKEKEGEIALYNDLSEDMMNFEKYVDIDFSLLSSEEKNLFLNGIRVYGKDAVSSLIEDYNS